MALDLLPPRVARQVTGERRQRPGSGTRVRSRPPHRSMPPEFQTLNPVPAKSRSVFVSPLRNGLNVRGIDRFAGHDTTPAVRSGPRRWQPGIAESLSVDNDSIDTKGKSLASPALHWSQRRHYRGGGRGTRSEPPGGIRCKNPAISHPTPHPPRSSSSTMTEDTGPPGLPRQISRR